MSQSASARQTQANNSGEVRKRQRTAALQNLRKFVRVRDREASWSAAVLCRFRRSCGACSGFPETVHVRPNRFDVFQAATAPHWHRLWNSLH